MSSSAPMRPAAASTSAQRRAALGLVAVDHRHHVESADEGMQPLVRGQVDVLDRRGGARHEPVGEVAGRPGERVHGPAVVGIGVDVEEQRRREAPAPLARARPRRCPRSRWARRSALAGSRTSRAASLTDPRWRLARELTRRSITRPVGGARSGRNGNTAARARNAYRGGRVVRVPPRDRGDGDRGSSSEVPEDVPRVASPGPRRRDAAAGDRPHGRGSPVQVEEAFAQSMSDDRGVRRPRAGDRPRARQARQRWRPGTAPAQLDRPRRSRSQRFESHVGPGARAARRADRERAGTGPAGGARAGRRGRTLPDQAR